ncbi:MAG: hypothetical protein ACLRNW_09010 [Neglectibacter sp.]
MDKQEFIQKMKDQPFSVLSDLVYQYIVDAIVEIRFPWLQNQYQAPIRRTGHQSDSHTHCFGASCGAKTGGAGR